MRRYDAQQSGARTRSGWSRSTASPRSSRAAGASRFTALVVVGDGAGRVGVGHGKAKEVPAAIQKGVEEAARSMFEVPMMGTTIPHEVIGEDGRGRRAAEAGRARDRRHRRRSGARGGGGRRHQGHPVEVARLVEPDQHRARRHARAAVAAAPAGDRARCAAATSTRSRRKPMLEAMAAADARCRRRSGAESPRAWGERGRAVGEAVMKLKVTQRRSVIDRPKDQKGTVRALGPAPHPRLRGQGRPAGDPGHDREGRAPRRRGGGGRDEAPSPPSGRGLDDGPASASAAARPAGQGKTAGRGTKGWGARHNPKLGFEGGQMPLQRRVPEAEGLHATRTASEFAVVNVERLAASFDAGPRSRRRPCCERGPGAQGHARSRCSAAASSTAP